MIIENNAIVRGGACSIIVLANSNTWNLPNLIKLDLVNVMRIIQG